MSREEKFQLVNDYCDSRANNCYQCDACDDKEAFCNKYPDLWGKATDEDLDYFIKKYIGLEETEEVEEPIQHDPVNHPKHYCRDGAMECFEEMLTLFGKDVVKHFCLCNAWKYRYRSNDKNGEEDIKKSDWYIQKYKELSE